MFGLPDAGKVRAAFAKYEAAKAAIPTTTLHDPLVLAMAQMFEDMNAAFPRQNGKMGRRPARIDSRTLKLDDYFLPALPPPPASVCNSRHVKNWGMMLNGPNPDPRFPKGIGDCTCAAVAHGHQVGVLSQVNAGVSAGIIMPSDGMVLDIYCRWCGFNPADPSTDQGGVELDVLNRWRQDGFDGRKILAYAAVNHRNTTHVKQAINLFGGVYIGLSLPDGWESAEMWDSNMGDAGSWGGHAVFCPDYYADQIPPLSWGASQPMTWGGFSQYCEECYAVVFADWIPPAGFDRAGLVADLAEVTS